MTKPTHLLGTAPAKPHSTTRKIWNGLRSVLGDDAYERYLEHMNRFHPDAPPLQRGDFYRIDLERRWSGINRCC